MIRRILVLLLGSSLSAMGQQQYEIKQNVRYYADSVNKQDEYISSHCILDIYYPKHVKNFATIVWFHGGGLTGGSKEIPKALMDKGYAVIGVGYRLSPKVKRRNILKMRPLRSPGLFEILAVAEGTPI